MLSLPEQAQAGATHADEGQLLQVRKAILTDISPLLELINRYASMGIMLPRNEFELSESIRDFTVILAGDRLVGCGALHFYGPATGEVRSLAVNPQWRNRGVGRQLMAALETEAQTHGLDSIFAFTYVPGFFEKFSFAEIDRAELPSKVWKDCLRCPKLQCCDEIAMRKPLRAGEEMVEATPRCAHHDPPNRGSVPLISLPTRNLP
jgi:amino-acid N-acetyltransferase